MQATWNHVIGVGAAMVGAGALTVLVAALKYTGLPHAHSVANDLLLWSPFPEGMYLLVAFPILTAAACGLIAWPSGPRSLTWQGAVAAFLIVSAYMLAYEWHVITVLRRTSPLF